MKSLRAFTWIIFLCGITLSTVAQSSHDTLHASVPDTIRLITGKIMITRVVDTTGKNIEVLKKFSNPSKKLEIDRNDIYKIIFGSSGKKIIYTIPDTIRLITGKIMITRVLDTSGKKIEVLKKLSNPSKKLEIDRNDIYKIIFGANGKKIIYNILDTVLLDDGKVVISHVTDTTGYEVEVIKPHSHKHKKIDIDKENIFQITFGSSGKRVVLYTYDTLIGNDLTVDEARRFIYGEQDAQHGYHAMGTTVAAFAVGVGSGTIGSFFALAPPFIFAGFMSYNYVKIRHNSVKDMQNVHHDGYLYGYSMVARRKRTSKALLWGGIGVAVGTVIHYIIANN